MLSELQPTGLRDAATALGVDPFELVRLGVASGRSPSAFVYSPDDLAALQKFGAMETLWAGDAPADANPGRGAVRGALKILIDRRFVGDSVTRLDNLWRGLDPARAAVVERALVALASEGFLRSLAQPNGVFVSITPAAEKALSAFANGGAAPAVLNAIW